MNIKNISPRFFVSEQLISLDVGAVAAQGIKTIMCNRPDNEAQGQPAASEIAAAAKGLGIEFVNMPIRGGLFTDDDVAQFEEAYRGMPGPILAYCRTGGRSIALWALAEARILDIDAVLSATKAAGFDLTPMRPLLVEQVPAAATGESAADAADYPD